jgi:hypothetical protein
MVAFDLAYTDTVLIDSNPKKRWVDIGLHYKYLIEDPLLESQRNSAGASDPDPRKKSTAKGLIRLALFVEGFHGHRSRFCFPP